MRFKLLLLAMTLCLLYTSSKGQTNNADQIEESELFSFHINYWFNMHHFLKHHSVNNEASKFEIFSKKEWPELSDSQAIQVEDALSYYRQTFQTYDLRTNRYMYDFKN